MNFNDLSVPIREKIFGFLSVAIIANSCCVSKYWRDTRADLQFLTINVIKFESDNINKFILNKCIGRLLLKCKLLKKYDVNDTLSFMKSLPHLQQLRVDMFSDNYLYSLDSLALLQHLDLSLNYYITDIGIKYICTLTHLQYLDLTAVNITDEGLCNIHALTRLQHLNIAYCKEITNDGIYYLKSLAQLQYLNIGFCNKITDVALNHISKLTQLQYLNIEFCNKITDEALKHISELLQLQYLCIASCYKLTIKGASYLITLNQLRYLDIAHCYKITIDGLYDLQKLLQLQYLNLRGRHNTIHEKEHCKEKCCEIYTCSLN